MTGPQIIWEPLLALAELAGGDWPVRAQNAALGLTAVAQEESPIVALLLDLWIMFIQQGCADRDGEGAVKRKGGTRVFSRDLVAGLNCEAERPWVALRKGNAVTELWLAQQLRPYGLKPKTIWIGETAAKGYLEEDFMEAFRRYIPKSAAQALLENAHAAAQKPEEGED